MQTVAGIAAMALNPQTALLAAGTNLEAAAVTALKIKADIENGKNPDLADLASIAGNAVVVAGSLALMISPQSKAVQVAANISRGIGLLGTALAISNKGLAEEFSSDLGSKINQLESALQNSSTYRIVYYYYDPLVLDLDGDGIETVAASGSSGAMFDQNGDGIRTATGWVNRDDGLLVRDIDGNGTIDNGTELFGDSTALGAGGKAANGFAALADMDSNGDGIVDAADANFAQLQVWRDLNQNGISEAGELFSLGQTGIQSFNTAVSNTASTVVAGGTQAETGSYTRTDGTVSTMADVNFTQDTFHSSYTTQITVPVALQSLPDVGGTGRLRNLQQAAALSPALAEALGQYSAATTLTARKALLTQVLVEWSKTDPLYSSSPVYLHTHYQTYSASSSNVVYVRAGSTFTLSSDAGVMASQEITDMVRVLDAIRGSTPTTDVFGGTANPAQAYVDAFNAVADSFSNSLESIRLQPLFDQIGIKVDSNGFTFDLSAVQTALKSRIFLDAASGLSDLLSFNKIAGEQGWLADTDWTSRSLRLFEGAVTSVAMTPELLAVLNDSYSNVVVTQSGVNTAGTTQTELIIGTAQNDVLSSGGGNDTLFAGGGDDTINAGTGNDTINGGDGNDTITDTGGTNVIDAGSGDDVVTASGNNTIYGGDGNDAVTVNYVGANRLEGGAGDDLLKVTHNGANGYDAGYYGESTTFVGGVGNDRLEGSSGADTYVFNRGDGSDTILDIGTNAYWSYLVKADTVQFGAGISASDISASRSGNNLLIKINDPLNPAGGDQITVENWWSSDAYRIETFTFSDGTSLSKAQIHTMAQTLNGTSGADVIAGWDENNIINAGSGNDTISDTGGTNVIDAGSGDDVVTASGNNTIYGGDGNDAVTVNYVGANRLEGGAGDDLLKVTHNGANGYDAGYYGESTTFVGGVGNDRLEGSSGADTYVFNRGDGSDTILDIGTNAYWSYLVKADTVQFGAGISASDISASRSGNNLLIKINDPLNPAGGDQITVENWWSSDAYRIETFTFSDGTGLSKAQIHTMVGTAGDDNLVGTVYSDTLAGLDGNDVLNGNLGNDILQGGAGNDTLTDTAGANLLDGGAGADTLTGSTGNELFAGGVGNDTITTGSGADIIAFNRGDGMDVVNGGVGTDNVVSLGCGINYADLALSKVSNNLILEVGNGEQITFANWYDTTANNKSVLDLQVMADAMAGFNATSTDPLLNQAVQNFNFTAVANAFDQARGTSATFMHWSATNSLLAARLSGSDTVALGGDLAHQYGTSGSFTGMNLTAAQTTLNDPLFGAQAQTLHALQGLQGGAVALQ
ncbi:beta strand repeat-containing protein [Gallionella capsiferriformans]|nr:calcium-binding protein [Gallionella capsiferriformans]